MRARRRLDQPSVVSFLCGDEALAAARKLVKGDTATLSKAWAKKNIIYKTAAAAIDAAISDTNGRKIYFGQVLTKNRDDKGKKVFT